MDEKDDSKEKKDRSPIHKSLLEAVSEIKIGKKDTSEIEDAYDLSGSEGFVSDDDHFEEIVTGGSLKDLLNVTQEENEEVEMDSPSFLTLNNDSTAKRLQDEKLFSSKSISAVYRSIKDEVETEMAQREDSPFENTLFSSRSLIVTEFCTELHHILIGKKTSKTERSEYFSALDRMKPEEFPEWTRGALIRSIDILNSKQ